MRACAPEVCSPGGIPEVVIRARVDEDIGPKGPQGEAERIRVAMGGDRLEAQLAAVEHHTDAITLALVPVLQQVIAGFRQGSGDEELVWRFRRHRIEVRATRTAK